MRCALYAQGVYTKHVGLNKVLLHKCTRTSYKQSYDTHHIMPPARRFTSRKQIYICHTNNLYNDTTIAPITHNSISSICISTHTHSIYANAKRVRVEWHSIKRIYCVILRMGWQTPHRPRHLCWQTKCWQRRNRHDSGPISVFVWWRQFWNAISHGVLSCCRDDAPRYA